MFLGCYCWTLSSGDSTHTAAHLHFMLGVGRYRFEFVILDDDDSLLSPLSPTQEDELTSLTRVVLCLVPKMNISLCHMTNSRIAYCMKKIMYLFPLDLIRLI